MLLSQRREVQRMKLKCNALKLAIIDENMQSIHQTINKRIMEVQQ